MEGAPATHDPIARKSSGIPFKSPKKIMEDARRRAQMAELEKTMVEEGHIDEGALQEGPMTSDETLTEEEKAKAAKVLQNFRNKTKMFSLPEKADEVLRSIGGYGRDGNYRRYIDPVEAENKARDFNKNHPLRGEFVASTVKGAHSGPDNFIFYRLKIEPRNSMTSIEANQVSLDRDLNDKIRTILESMGVSIGAINELERR